MTDPMWLDQQIRRIDADRAATQRLLAETQQRLVQRLCARGFNRDPWILVGSAVLVALIVRLPEILHAAGLLQPP